MTNKGSGGENMIYTLTLNPSVDYVVQLDHEVRLGELNRTISDSKFPGGKGINVSRVLQRLGVKNRAIGFIGGFTGNYIEDYLHNEQIETGFVKVIGDTRINIILITSKETEINASGPAIYPDQIEQLKKIIHSLLSDDILVLAGSIPTTLSNTIYEELIEICAEKNTQFVVDVEGNLMKNVLFYKPFLVKPNQYELGMIFGEIFTTPAEVIPYAKKLIEMGAQNVIVSLAGEGAVFVNSENIMIADVPKGKVKSSVGAGDSMVAGFLAKYGQTKNIEESFRYSVACGSATAFSLDLCTRDQVITILDQVKIIKYDS